MDDVGKRKIMLTEDAIAASRRALDVTERGKEYMKIRDDAHLSEANDLVLLIGDMEKEVDRTFDPIRDAAHKTWKAAVKAKNDVKDPLTDTRKKISAGIGRYVHEQEEARRREEERLRREAERQLEDSRLDEAISAEAAGEKDMADVIMESPVHVPPPTLPSVKEQLKGISVQVTWRGEVRDFETFARWAVAEGKWALIGFNQGKINAYITMMKGKTKIPGVDIVEEAGTRRHGRR